jgi:predicted acylesterase/phospholipase RssA
MKRRPRDGDSQAIKSHMKKIYPPSEKGNIGLVLSGGGSRAAYQAGALKALTDYLSKPGNEIRVVIGSSIGAINGLVVAAGLKEGVENSVDELISIWAERNFKNTFSGSPSMAFLKAIKVAVWQYLSPGPKPNADSIFNPKPLMDRIDQVLTKHGGLHPDVRHAALDAVAVMTTIEGTERKPLVFLSSDKECSEEAMRGAWFTIAHRKEMDARHGFASAALPSILPPVELDTEHGKVRLVDGGISANIPIDPAVRLGARRIIAIDVSGRSWWLEHFKQPQDSRPEWEVLAGFDTFCMRPPDTFTIRCQKPLGPFLKASVGSSTKKFMTAVGPTWPLFSLLKNKLGEDVAYETMTYVALDSDYLNAIIEAGYNETMEMLKNKDEPEFHKTTSFKQWVEELEEESGVK